MDILNRFKLTGGFLGRYQQLIQDIAIPYQEKVLNDQVEGAEKSHAIENFRAAARVLEEGQNDEPFYGMVFQDSDVAKWLEAAAYSLALRPDPELERRCDEVIELIGHAQCADGYLNTYFTVKSPELRWTNLQEAHELYCAGHMMEAAVAYHKATGKTQLLDIMQGMSDHIYRRFVQEGTEGYPGHPEVELALMRMYRATGTERYKTLAQHFVDARGVDSDYFIKERERSKWVVWGNDPTVKEYLQGQAPVREQTEAVGHSVRAVYLYTAMADIAAETGDASLQTACETLWQNITQRRMYLTGGIGSAYEGEQFTKDYHLPNDTAYSETCASIGLIFFARKMLDLAKKGLYADVMERALYNCVLAGMQLDGTRFFYVNPLEVLPGISGETPAHKHALPQRPKWFACACCPPNVARLMTSIAEYAWSVEKKTVYNHLFLEGTLDLGDTLGAGAALGGALRVETAYPYEGQITYHFKPTGEAMDMTLALHLPDWSGNTRITRNGTAVSCLQKDGYAYIEGPFHADDQVVLELDMEVKRIFPSSQIAADSGRVAFTRGPLVYCAEGVDNDGDVLALRVAKDSQAKTQASEDLGGIIRIAVEGYKLESGNALYTDSRPKATPCPITLIPYYAWGNRGLTQMRVWLPEMA